MDDGKMPTGRMIRAARGLINLDQVKLAELMGVSRRTVIRMEADGPPPTNPRRIEICSAIRDLLEKEYDIKFVYADRKTGEGVVMKKGK
jgi:DNA-binding XRE family transcriptional regulator